MIKAIFDRITLGEAKMVFIVRTDLGMGKGKIASQVAHAAVDLYKKSLDTSNPHLNNWWQSGQAKLVLRVDSEQKLLDIHQKALKSNLNVSTIRDAGRTQIEEGTITVIGIGPNSTTDIDPITKQLKLL